MIERATALKPADRYQDGAALLAAVDGAVPESVPAARERPRGAMTVPAPGDVLAGKYRVERVIGAGGWAWWSRRGTSS